MTDPNDPIRGPSRPRSVGRRLSDRDTPESEEPEVFLPVPAGEAIRHAPSEPPAPDSAVAAQIMAGAPKRGLKGGPETLEKARSTYLGTEYSGANDRRPKAGLIKKTEV